VGYTLIMRDDSGKTGRFFGMLGRLDGRLVLDAVPVVTHLDAPQMFIGMLQPLHAFVVIDSIGPQARFTILDPDTLRAYLVAHPGAVRADTLTEGVILEGSPPQLRAFLRTYLRRPGVLQPASTMLRCTTCPPPGR
jgi:hypothetical protein